MVSFFFFAFFRKILLNHNATMSFARKTPSSLVTAGMLLKNIAIFWLLIMNNDRVCSLLNQYLLACILFWLTHCCLVSDFSFFSDNVLTYPVLLVSVESTYCCTRVLRSEFNQSQAARRSLLSGV